MVYNSNFFAGKIVRFVKQVVGDSNIMDEAEQYRMYKYLCFIRNQSMS